MFTRPVRAGLSRMPFSIAFAPLRLCALSLVLTTGPRAALAQPAPTAPAAPAAAPIRAEVTIRADRAQAKIDRNIYGSFAEHLGRGIDEGIWVGEGSPIPNTRGIRNDVIAALRNLKLTVLRWPGGCFADEYHWRDGIGPRGKRPRRVNTSWGGIETNAFGLHVVEMYEVHQDATSLPVELRAPRHALGKGSVPNLHASASRDAQGVLHRSMVNLDPNRPADVALRVNGASPRSARGRTLTAPNMAALDDFGAAPSVKPEALSGVHLAGDRIRLSLPSKSVTVSALE